MPNKSGQSWPKVIEQAIDTLTKFSIPLYVNDWNGRPDQFGTGFIVKASDSHFLVSAAHVLDVARKRDVFYYAGTKTLRHLNGRVVTTGHPDDRDNDKLDVGVMLLTGAGIPPYKEVQKFAMDIEYLKPSHLPRSGKHYVIVGFPATKSGVDPISRTAFASAYAYRSDSSEEMEYKQQGVSMETHIVLPLNLRKGVGKDGRIREFPKPQGMSGSPIIVLYDVNEGAGDSRVFPVVAVGTRYRKRSKVLIGTDIQFVIEAIEKMRSGAAERI